MSGTAFIESPYWNYDDLSICQNFDRVVRACLAMRCGSPAWQEEQDRRSFFRVRMLCFSRGAARLLKDQMTRATSLMLREKHQTDEGGTAFPPSLNDRKV